MLIVNKKTARLEKALRLLYTFVELSQLNKTIKFFPCQAIGGGFSFLATMGFPGFYGIFPREFF